MIAYRRSDVAELNAVARTLLDREGCLGRHRLRLTDATERAVGDRVLCTRNDRRLCVANGDRGTVTDVDRQSRAIVVELDDRRRLKLPRPYLAAGHLTHATRSPTTRPKDSPSSEHSCLPTRTDS